LTKQKATTSTYLNQNTTDEEEGYAHNIGFAARLAGHWSNGHFIAVVLHLGWTFNLELLFVNFSFYIFNQQRFRAGRAMNSSPAASPARYAQCYDDSATDEHCSLTSNFCVKLHDQMRRF
jgi:hypothetical protein